MNVLVIDFKLTVSYGCTKWTSRGSFCLFTRSTAEPKERVCVYALHGRAKGECVLKAVTPAKAANKLVSLFNACFDEEPEAELCERGWFQEVSPS